MRFAEATKRPTLGDIWYRYEGVAYAAPVDEFDRPYGAGRVEVVCATYTVVKVTPKGVWLSDFWPRGARRFVLNQSRKRFACPTKAEALESFVARKKRQASILAAQHDRALRWIKIAEEVKP